MRKECAMLYKDINLFKEKMSSKQNKTKKKKKNANGDSLTGSTIMKVEW